MRAHKYSRTQAVYPTTAVKNKKNQYTFYPTVAHDILLCCFSLLDWDLVLQQHLGDELHQSGY